MRACARVIFQISQCHTVRQTQQRTIRSPSSSSHCDHVPNDRVGPPYITSLTEQGVPHICLSPFLPSSLGLKRRLSQFALRRQALASTLAEDAPQPRAQTLGAAVPRNGVCVRVGVVVHPDGVVDGRWDLDQEMRHCQIPYKCMRQLRLDSSTETSLKPTAKCEGEVLLIGCVNTYS